MMRIKFLGRAGRMIARRCLAVEVLEQTGENLAMDVEIADGPGGAANLAQQALPALNGIGKSSL